MGAEWHSVLAVLLLVAAPPPTWGESGKRDVSQFAPTKDSFRRLDKHTDKTIDQLITEALGGIDVASNKILAPGEHVLAELDMYLTQDQFLALYEPPSRDLMMEPNGTTYLTARHKRKAIRNAIHRWTNAEIPFQFARGHFDEKEEYILRQSMTEWERYTCLKFRPATNADRNFVRFQNGDACSSQVGMVGGVQLLNLDVRGCRFKGLYLHEMGHAIGLFHEHQLPDRDQYIEILYHNVAPQFRIFFNKYSPQRVNQFGVPYEYSSVMHYGITAFSYDAQAQTIRTKDPTKEASIGRVYLKELAFSDVKVVNEMYSCNAMCADTVKCIGAGFLDQNCNCVCPDGSKECEIRLDKKDSDTDKTVATAGCVNQYDDWKCAVWANQGECQKNVKYMQRSCQKACGLCDEEKKQEDKNHFTTWAWQWFGMFTNLFPRDWMIGQCKDVYSFEKCSKWKQQGDCVTNADWMNDNCKMTCNACNLVLRPETSCRNRHHNDDECDRWALDGECVLNADWMKDQCTRSCHACAVDPSDPDTSDEDDKETNPREEEEDDCHDVHDSKQCADWAIRDECNANPGWMIANCRKSCAKCDDGECKNLYGDTQCMIWAEDLECLKNRDWMHSNCAKSCGVCDANDSDTGTGTRTGTGTGRKDTGTGRGKVTRRPVVTRRPEVRTTRQPHTATCYNLHNDVECEMWADTGHCDINPEWMHSKCRRACHRCEATTTVSVKAVCEDKDAGCAGWAKNGFCQKNPRYNLIYCKKSCNNCNGCRDDQFLCPVWAKAGHCMTNAAYMLRHCQKSCKEACM